MELGNSSKMGLYWPPLIPSRACQFLTSIKLDHKQLNFHACQPRRAKLRLESRIQNKGIRQKKRKCSKRIVS